MSRGKLLFNISDSLIHLSNSICLNNSVMRYILAANKHTAVYFDCTLGVDPWSCNNNKTLIITAMFLCVCEYWYMVIVNHSLLGIAFAYGVFGFKYSLETRLSINWMVFDRWTTKRWKKMQLYYCFAIELKRCDCVTTT